MSRIPTQIDEKTIDYIRNLFAPEDDFLKDLLHQSQRLNFPQISIAPEQAVFLQFLIKASGAKNILEVGSLFGYSAISMARALPNGGKLIAVEIDERFAKFIRKKASEAGLSDKIEVVNANAVEFLESYSSETLFDFVFLDADKTNYVNYLNLVTPLLKKGGILAADNALAFGFIADDEIEIDESRLNDIKAMREFNSYLANHKAFLSSFVTLGDGIAMGVKL